MHTLFKLIITTVPLIVAVMWYIAHRQAANSSPQRGPLPDETKAILHGAQLIADGVSFYGDWAAAMLREFDQAVQPNLRKWYEIAQDLSRQPVNQWHSARIAALCHWSTGCHYWPGQPTEPSKR